MAPPSKVEKLPPEILEAARELLRTGKTVDEITTHLRSLGAEVSRSSVGRWKKSASKSMKALQRAQAFGAEWAKSLKEDPEGQVGRLLIELGKTSALDYLLDRADDGEEGSEAQPLDVKSLFFLSSAVKNFESAGSLNTARELRIRKEFAEKAADAVEKVATEGGMSADFIKKLRDGVLKQAS